MHLLRATGAGDHGAHIGVAHTPGNGQLRQAAAQIGCDRLELAHNRQILRVGQRAAEPLVAGQRAATVGRNAAQVFAGEQPEARGLQIVNPSPMVL